MLMFVAVPNVTIRMLDAMAGAALSAPVVGGGEEGLCSLHAAPLHGLPDHLWGAGGDPHAVCLGLSRQLVGAAGRRVLRPAWEIIGCGVCPLGINQTHVVVRVSRLGCHAIVVVHKHGE